MTPRCLFDPADLVDIVRAARTSATSPRESRYLTRGQCETLFHHLVAMAAGSGDTVVTIESTWRGHLRWALNRITTSGDTTDHTVTVTRVIHGASGTASTNKLDDTGLTFALRTAERRLRLEVERPDAPPPPSSFGGYATPALFADASFTLTAAARSAVGRALVAPVIAADLVSAGYVEVGAHARAVFNTTGLAEYYAGTTAQYSTTVRAKDDSASGWAGVDDNDWSRIDAADISRRALQKCLSSAHPRAIEPGRYTAILEPQAVHDLFFPAIEALDRYAAENLQTVYTLSPGMSKIGKRLLDPRITVRTDPADPVCGYLPFDDRGEPFQATEWFTDGVLTALAYDSSYALTQLGTDTPRPNPYAYHMTGGAATAEEMIASTPRGVLVTRLSDVAVVDPVTLLCTGVTRDGLWYVENGAIKHPIKNFRIAASPMLVFNSVGALGVPRRVFARAPAVVPPVKVHDFHFTSLADVV